MFIQKLKSCRHIIPLLILLVFSGCAVHSSLMPLGTGNTEVNVSAGGPFIPITEPKIPVPYLTGGMNYGVSENVNVTANLHITSLFYKVAGLDLGAAYFPLLNDGLIPAVGIQPSLLFFSSLKSEIDSRFRIYPFVSFSAAWETGTGIIYTGSDLVIPLSKADYYDEQESYVLSPFLGYKWNLGNNYTLFTEIKWQGANIRSDMVAVEYIDVNRYGAFSFLISLSRSF